MDIRNLGLYLEQADRTGYCIMNDVDFAILPKEVYYNLLKIKEVHDVINNYKNKNKE